MTGPQVTVPEGVVPGETLSIETEWGEIEVEVPEGLVAGDTFEVSLSAVAADTSATAGGSSP